MTASGILLGYHSLDLLVDAVPVRVERVCELGPYYIPFARHGLC